jgi:predicted MFS family arabinose efflux permease
LNLDPNAEPKNEIKRSFWGALRHRHFRILWMGLIVSAAGTWMQIVAQSVLVLQLTHGSAFALGCVALAQASAFLLFALVGGGLADRVNKKKLLLVTQAALMAMAATLGILTTMSRINVEMIAVCAFVAGAILSVDQPARAALISSLVPAGDLLSAISLQSAVFNGAAVAGPALAGFVIAGMGLPANFFLNALSYVAVLCGLLCVPAQTGVGKSREGLREQIVSALRTVWRDAFLWRHLCAYGMLLFAGPSLPLLIPVLAAERLHAGPATLGLLFSAAGLGAVIGTVGLAQFSRTNVWLARTCFAGWCLALVVTSMSSFVPLTFCALVLLGASQSIVGATTAALLQTRVSPQQRGRVMSLNTLLLMGVRPLGDFPGGAAISLIGPSATVMASAVLVATTAGVLLGKRGTTPTP